MLKILRRNKTIAGIIAIFAGTIGLHCFYMGRYKKGILYLLFFWTGIPTILGILDGARLLTQVAEEETESGIDDEIEEADEESDVEDLEDEDVEDLEDDDEDDSEEDEPEDEEESEMDEKIKKFRNKNSRRAK